MRPKPIVYRATNLVNGKRYIGTTVKGLKQRKYEHGLAAMSNKKGCRIFNAAIRKYGADLFLWRVVRECETREEALLEEKRLIELWRPEYNITAGGRGVFAPRTPEWKANIKKALVGRKVSPEAIAKMKAARDPMLFARAVICLNDGLRFPRIKDAAAHYGVRHESIGEVLAGRQYVTGGGLCFIYDDGSPFSDEDRLAALANVRDNRQISLERRAARKPTPPRPVICIETGERFESAVAAALAAGMKVSGSVWLACRKGALAYGRHYRYEDSPPVVKDKAYWARAKENHLAGAKRGGLKKLKPVIRVRDGKIYPGVMVAAKDNGISFQKVSVFCREGAATAPFRFLDADHELPDREKAALVESRRARARDWKKRNAAHVKAYMEAWHAKQRATPSI